MFIVTYAGSSLFELLPGEQLWDYSIPSYRTELEENWSDLLEGEWSAKNTLVSFEATYYDRSRYEMSEFYDKKVHINTFESDKLVLPEDLFGGETIQFDDNAKIIELVDEETLKDKSSEGFRRMTYSGELNRTSEDRFILTLDVSYNQHIDNFEDNPWGKKGEANIINVKYRAIFIKEIESDSNDSIYNRAIEKVNKTWNWFKNIVSSEEFKVPKIPSAVAGVRG